MSDFNNGFNPANQKNQGINFNPNKQGKGSQPEESAESAEQSKPVDPWANTRPDPDHVLNLLAMQGKLNMPAEALMHTNMQAFGAQISPDRHAFASRMLEQAYTQEFGKPPAPGMLQELVDNYLIGHVVIQAS
jgi:hypothetical protein